MLRLLRSIFGTATPGKYPESLIKEAIERAVDGTDPALRAVSGYGKKLRPAVLRAIDHVVTMVDSLPAPLPLSFSKLSADPRVKNFFLSAHDMKNVLSRDRNLALFLKGPTATADKAIALLAMEKQEKVVFGAALSGEIVIHDVPQVTVSFDGHRLLDPTDDEVKTRRLLMRRAYDHLLTLALKRLTFVKEEREELTRRSALLQAKLNLLQREGWGFDEAAPSEEDSVAEVEEKLGQIEAELNQLGGKYGEHETYLQTVADILGNPEEYLHSRRETLFVNRMGIKQNEETFDAPALTFNELRNAEGRTVSVILVSLQGEELQGLGA